MVSKVVKYLETPLFTRKNVIGNFLLAQLQMSDRVKI